MNRVFIRLIILLLLGLNVGMINCGGTNEATPSPTLDNNSTEANCTIEADFVAWPREVDGKQLIRFTDESTGNITSWAWDFNCDGQIDSTEQNPTHIYTKNGTYCVSLTVYALNCEAYLIKYDYITVTGCET